MAKSKKVSVKKRSTPKSSINIKKHANLKKNKGFKAITANPKKNKKAEKVAKGNKNPEVEQSDESDHGEDLLDMVEDDDLEFLKSAIENRSYSLLNKVKFNQSAQNAKKRKHKAEEDDLLENDYENQLEAPKLMKHLLPIKTKTGIVPQAIEQEDEEDEEIYKKNENQNENQKEEQDDQNEEDTEGEYVLENPGLDLTKPVSAAEMLAARNKVLIQKKIHIGTLSSGLLESPEEKLTNFRTLIKILDDDTPEVYITIRKLAIVALLEVFKDVLPSYEIKLQDISTVKVKKDTLKLHKFEESLLQYYKKYLQKLEKISSFLFKKRGDNRKRTDGQNALGELAVHAMCDLLVAHPYFNFSHNLAQAVVPFLNNPNRNVRQLVVAAVKTVFKEDKKEEITLKIMRVINQYLRNHAHNVNTDMLEVLLGLRIKDINLDQEIENDRKQKKLNSHKQNVLSLSKNERKRKKKLQNLEKEMLETKAEENKQLKQKNLTEITKILFGIYFRILKSSTNTKVLGVCLEGLAKYSHCINLEFYVDIVNVLDKLLKEDWMGYREKLNCIRTVFSILSGQGEAINMDPTRFYNYLYKDLLVTNAGKNHDNFCLLLYALIDAIIKRRKKITNKRIIGFVKRLATLSLQLLHNSGISSLAVIKTVLQLNNAADILLDLDNTFGDGEYKPELDDPEYCGAASTALYELTLLNKHYHPIVGKYARHIANGVPASGEGSLPPVYGKCTPEQLYTDFDMSELCFNPSISVPKKAQAKTRPGKHHFNDEVFKKMCFDRCKIYTKKLGSFYIDF